MNTLTTVSNRHKRPYKIRLLLALIGFFAGFTLFGQDVSFSASVNKNPVGVNDNFSLTLTLNNADGDILAPDISDFILLYGPGSSTSIQFVNGKRSSSYAYTYTLKPKAEGNFKIGPFKAKANGKTYSSNVIDFKVVKGQPAQVNQQNKGNSATQQPTAISGNQDNLIIKIKLNKSRIYVGEAVLATFVLYSRYQSLELQEFESPAFNGFWAEELENKRASWDDKIEVIDGKQYRKATLRQVVLIPQHAGNIKINKIKLSALVNASFFNRGSLVETYSNAPVIKVKPLPEGKPADFSGAVGSFELKAKTSEVEINTNDALNFVVEVKGSGNLKLVNAFNVQFPGDFEKYDPKSSENISVNQNGMNGVKKWDYLLIPRHEGNYEIPSLRFSYFDLKTKKYKTISAPAIPIKVNKGNNSVEAAGGLVYSSPNKQDFQLLDEDIRYINNSTPLFIPNGQYLFGSFRYYAMFFAPALFFIGFVFIRRKVEDASKDVVGRKMKRAQKKAFHHLKLAENEKKKDGQDFYDHVSTALYGYIRDKVNMGNAELNKSVIEDRLKEKNLDPALIKDFLYVTETCEMARFAPIGDVSKQELIDRSKEIIVQIEKKIG